MFVDLNLQLVGVGNPHGSAEGFVGNGVVPDSLAVKVRNGVVD